MKNTVYDIEVAPNQSMVGFKDLDNGRVTQFDRSETSAIAKHLKGRTLIGFNSKNYDNLILTAMLYGKTQKEIYSMSVDLIEGDGNRWDYPDVITGDIDIREVAPGDVSLKLYASILGAKTLQDLPYNPHEKHSKKMWKNVCKYNVNDLDLTELLYNELKPRLDLRKKLGKQYSIDILSRSDAQVAEDIFRVELKKIGIDAKAAKKKVTPISNIHYLAPKAVKFKNPTLNALVKRIQKTTIEIGGGGSPMIPDWLKKQIVVIGGAAYNIQLGGLHSMESAAAIIPPKGYKLGNVDVASMYPSMIIEMGLFPQHLTKAFLGIYTKIRDTRMEAKRSGNSVVSDTLKIVLNGSYGKFGSKYSFLYSPDLMLQVTLTGQLYLLMLIEAFEDAGIKVVSSNTDGIELVYKDIHDVKKIVKKWEKRTGLDMEYGTYKALYSRDVNAYIAIYTDYAKRKGFYDTPGLKVSGVKNVEYPIVTEAITQFLLAGKSISDTIMECEDPGQFCVARQVNGGAVWSGETYPNTEEYDNYIEKGLKKNKALEKRNETYQKEFVLADAEKYFIGKVIRYYYSIDGRPIFSKARGSRIGKTDEHNGVKPMMKLKKKIPKDLDYTAYIDFAYRHLKELGHE